MPKSFDAIVIGTGQSGPSLAVKLADSGQKVAVVERARFGGTCVNTGCIPTKTMVASAYAAHMARRSAEYGVIIEGPVRVDMKQVMARKSAVSAKSRTGLEKMLGGNANCTVYRGHGRFISNYEVQIDDEVIASKQIFINVGTRAQVPDIPGLKSVPYLTNSSILEIDFLPEDLIIVGGSYVGLEFGQMFRRFGSNVSILERGAFLLGREDEDISNRVRSILSKEGIRVLANCSRVSCSKVSDGIEVQTGSAEGSTVKGTHLLLAAGRKPNTDDLGLENSNIKLDARGFIEVDDELHTSVTGIWATGDCNGRGAFTHTSYNDYEIVAANLFDHDNRRVTDRITAYAIYTDPPLARVGMTEKEVRQSGRKALIGKREMTRVGRAVEKGETEGFMKIMVDAENYKILGAAILGTGGDEAVHCILDTMYANAPYTVLQRAVHIHPTLSELIPTMLGDLKPLC
jgi:pyruvate/2-oxoglutarate dehydrogenase complex dihydrolipoamide dehydrogenase (E3) component